MEKNNVEVVKPVKKERVNIFLFALGMFILFVLVFLTVHVLLSNFFFETMFSSIHTYDIIGEAILAILAFIVLLFWKNSYVFTQKQEKFLPSLRYGWFYLVMGVLFMLLYGGSAMNNIPGVINTAIFALLVGIYEEFLCRGWLLNEFLERYGETKKGVWISIIASGVIFGLIHFINVSSSGVAGTITQVLSASASGILFGFIYYKTKNIWSVVFLHAYWDFTLFLADLAPITEVTMNISATSALAIIGSILLVVSELLVLIPFRKDVDANVKHGTLFGFALLSCVAYFVSFIITGLGLIGNIGESYEIGNLEMKEYSITMDNYETYDLNIEVQIADADGSYIPNNYSFSLYKTNSMLTLKNNITNESVDLEYTGLYDYAMYEFNEYFLLAYVDKDDDGNVFLKYHYLYKDELSNESDYLQIVKNSGFKSLISGGGDLCLLNEKETGLQYLTVDTTDYGYFVLVEKESISILNRD